MQLLNAIRPFKVAIMNSSSTAPFVKGLQEILGGLDSPNGISATRLEELLRNNIFSLTGFTLDRQSDAAEFIVKLFNRLDSDSVNAGGDPQATQCFLFEIHETVQAISNPNLFRNLAAVRGNSLTIPLQRNFVDSLRSLGKAELTGDNQVSIGGSLVDAIVYHRIKNPPPFLLVMLNRFGCHNGSVSKDNAPMPIPMRFDFPEEIMLHPKAVSCELVGGIVHCGTAERGHYVAYIRISGRFLRFSDTWVEIVTDVEVLESLEKGAYVVAYERSN
jgi:uncharacterized UBP type Zn finger protein